MDFKKGILAIFISLWFGLLIATSVDTNQYELTETDITLKQDFCSNQVTIYGVALGMDKQEVINKVSTNNELIIVDETKNSRMRIYDKKSDGTKNKDILLFVWDPQNQKISEMIIYGNFKKYLKGDTKLLLNTNVIDSKSKILKSFLGNFDKSEIKSNSEYYKSTRYYYNSINIAIDIDVVVKSESVRLNLFNFEENKKEEKSNFRNTKWGMNLSEVKKTENNAPILEKDDLLVYKDFVAELECEVIYIFTENKLVRAKYIFKETHTNKNDYILDFENLKKLLNKKYNEPYFSKQWKNDLYKNDYDQWGFAISIGHLLYFAEWSILNSSVKLILQGENYEIGLQLEYSSKMLHYIEDKKKEMQILKDL
ncbi:hypothetical protein D4R71_08350 [bacterium]|nr:MAG: hypothetical protein D4R71_08350 [bacterium]